MSNKQQKAVEHLKEGRFEPALKLFNELIKSDNRNADLFSYRGTVYLNLKRKREALSDFNRAVELDAGYSYRYASRAFAKDALGDLAGAIADYEKAVELDPEDAIAHNNLGLLLEKQGNMPKAKQHFKTADDFASHFLGSENGQKHPKPGSDINLQPTKLKPDPKKLTGNLLWKQTLTIFSSRKEFNQFVSFIFRGLK
ncbi:MAG: tetratricopeptide repeat protein [Cryomorphaceae bacterium]|nr:MAG: tetratricopeptide repeat protein [Cryomorphaceae bacterium]